jgi:cell division septal protein FtsQ
MGRGNSDQKAFNAAGAEGGGGTQRGKAATEVKEVKKVKWVTSVTWVRKFPRGLRAYWAIALQGREKSQRPSAAKGQPQEANGSDRKI